MKCPSALVALCVSLIAIPIASEAAARSDEGPRERVVYSSYRPAGWDLYLYDAPGTAPTRLTEHPALDYAATFSADGRWIVFTSERDGNPSLYVLDRTGQVDPRLLIRSDAMQDQATLSPDGRWIAFVSTHAGDADIYRLPFHPETTQDIAKANNLTRHPGGDFRPAYSPDGARIAFSSDRDGSPSRHPRFPFALRNEGEVYVMAADGSDVKRLTHSPGWDGSPAWTADGRTLYFYSERDGKTPFRIYSVAASGGEASPASPEGLAALSPAVRQDGSLVFASFIQQGPDVRWSIKTTGMDGAVDDVAEGIDCLEPDVHWPSGAMVCHGGPPLPGESVGGFPGPLLVAGAPQSFTLPGRTINLSGVRHAFTAPPHPVRDEILFRETPRRIAIAASDGTDASGILDLDELADSPTGVISHLRYTRDGAWVSFTVGPFAGGPMEPADVWRMRADGTGLVNLTAGTPGNDGLAEFSADGNTFVFRSGRTGNFDIYLADADGTHVRNLTAHPGSDTFPALSPRGDQVAFISDRNGVLDAATGRRTFDVYTLDLEGGTTPGTLRRITENAAQDAHVGYSPDGDWLIYASGKNGLADESPLVQSVLFNPQMYGEIHAYRIADGTTVRLTHNKWEDGAPIWEPASRFPARPSVSQALASVIEKAGADAAAVRHRALAQDAPMAYRFGEGGLYRLADRFMDEGKRHAANETLRLLGQLQSDSTRPTLALAEALMKQGNKTDAIARYREVLGKHPENLAAPWALFNAGAAGYEEVAFAPQQLAAYVGTYRIRQAGVVMAVSLQDGQLQLQPPGQPPLPLGAVSDRRFYARPFPMQVDFVRDGEGRVIGMEIRPPDGGAVDQFDRVPDA